MADEETGSANGATGSADKDGAEQGPGGSTGGPGGAAGVLVDQAARDLLEPEVEHVLASVRTGEARARFLALQQAVAAGRVEADSLPALEQLLALGIETGRFEKVHGRAADTLARGLFGRTPGGRARAEQAAAVSRALGALRGAALDGLTFASDGPGAYRLTIETDRGEMLVRIDRDGVRVDSIGIGV